MLGPEYAYRELRKSAEDYIEVLTLSDAMRGVELLLQQPERYAAMIANGQRRAREFTHVAILRQWAQLLFETLPARTADTRVRRWRGRSLSARKYFRRFLPFFDP